MMEPLPHAIQLPDGAWIRGRGLRDAQPDGPDPTFGLYLGVDYAPRWPHQHLDWPDFRLPRHRDTAIDALRDAHRRALSGERVEIACAGGRGRTGTAIAVLAVFAGVAPQSAVAWTRAHYHPGAVETPWQRRWVARIRC